jgi:hypothetical protein
VTQPSAASRISNGSLERCHLKNPAAATGRGSKAASAQSCLAGAERLNDFDAALVASRNRASNRGLSERFAVLEKHDRSPPREAKIRGIWRQTLHRWILQCQADDVITDFVTDVVPTLSWPPDLRKVRSARAYSKPWKFVRHTNSAAIFPPNTTPYEPPPGSRTTKPSASLLNLSCSPKAQRSFKCSQVSAVRPIVQLLGEHRRETFVRTPFLWYRCFRDIAGKAVQP